MSKPASRGFEALDKCIEIEASPGLEETMARLNDKLKPSPAMTKLIESFERDSNVVRTKFASLDAATSAAADAANISSFVNSDVHQRMLEAARNSPEARTARAAEEMRGHMQSLAEAALRADERADEAEARVAVLERERKSDRRWNRVGVICAAIAAVAAIIVIFIGG